MRLLGEMARNSGSNCSPVPMLTGTMRYGQPGLLEEHGDLVPVRRGPIMQVDHALLPFTRRDQQWHAAAARGERTEPDCAMDIRYEPR